MEKNPLLPYISPRMARPSPPPPLCPVPENAEITVPPTPSPSSKELKDMLIFGSPSSSSSLLKQTSSSSILEALTLSLATSKPSVANLDDERSNLDPENQKSWLLDLDCSASKSNLHRSKTAPSMATINVIDHSSCTKQPQFGKSSIVRQAVVDALYFCIVTMRTIGYGDITPDGDLTKLFSIAFVLVGFGFIGILLSGMVSYVLDLQENYLLRTINGRGFHDPGSYIIDVKKGRMRIRMKVAFALGVVVLCIGIGVAALQFVENLNLLDSFYLSVMSVTTDGYGDRAFNSLTGRIFASVWLLVSTLAVARAFLYLAEARVDKRHRRMAKWVLGLDMMVAQFLAADIDNNGFVSKSEHAIYKLKEMCKV